MASSRRSPIAFARGEVFWCDLDPVVGSEQEGLRPVVIVSTDDFANSEVRTVVPATKTEYRGEAAFVVKMHPHQTGLSYISWALAHQVRTVSIERLSKGGRVGFVAPETLAAIEDALRYAQGLDD